jgi:hypothetical protein
MSNVVEPTILPFKCQDVLVKLGSSCKKQEEIYNHLYNLNTGVTTLAPNSVAIGSGLGDASWNEALNYEKNQKEINEKLAQEAKEKAVSNISVLVDENKKKDYLIYGVALVLVLGVVIFEVTNKK